MQIWNETNTSTIFGINGTTQLTLTSSSLYTASGINVSIGASSTSSKLYAASSVNYNPSLTTGAASGFLINNAGQEISFGGSGIAPYPNYIQSRASGIGWDLAINPLGGNVGIGTSSPSSGVSSTQTVLEIANGNVAALSLNNTAAKKYTIYSSTQSSLSFYDVTAATERARITSAGDLGVGNAVQSNVNYQFGQNLTDSFGTIPNCIIGRRLGVSASPYSPVLSLGHYSSSYGMDLWVDTAGLSPGYIDIRQNESLIFRKNTTSGTASETMRIDSSGNLLVGTTSASGIITTSANVNSQAGAISTRNINAFSGSYSGLTIGNNISSNYAGFLLTSSGQASSGFFAPNSVYAYAGVGQIAIVTETANPIIFGTSGIERMRIDSSGRVGIGRSSMSYELDVSGNNGGGIRYTDNTNSVQNLFSSYNSTGLVGTLTNHPLTFWANNAERARIDSSGNLLVGTTTVKDVLTVSNGISMVGGGAGITQSYSGTDTRTWASSYLASGGTQTLCRIDSPNGSYAGGGLVRVTTSYQYRGGNPGNNYAQYMVTTNTTATANLIFSAGTYPTITVTTVGSGATATLDVIVNYSGDSHVQVVVEVFGKVVSWSI
jgi:hypothetical protein